LGGWSLIKKPGTTVWLCPLLPERVPEKARRGREQQQAD